MKDKTILVDTSISFAQPTRRCMVCDRLENPESKIMYNDKPWFCERCKKVLREVVERNKHA